MRNHILLVALGLATVGCARSAAVSSVEPAAPALVAMWPQVAGWGLKVQLPQSGYLTVVEWNQTGELALMPLLGDDGTREFPAGTNQVSTAGITILPHSRGSTCGIHEESVVAERQIMAQISNPVVASNNPWLRRTGACRDWTPRARSTFLVFATRAPVPSEVLARAIESSTDVSTPPGAVAGLSRALAAYHPVACLVTPGGNIPRMWSAPGLCQQGSRS